MTRVRLKRLRICLPLIAALVVAPLLPAFAAPVLVPAPAPDAHAHHGLQAPDESSPCTQHAHCAGFCCSACAHCAVVTPGDPVSARIAASASPATIPALHGFFVPSRINRPPQAA